MVPVVAAALAHFAGLASGFTNWDDPSYLIYNPLTEDPLAEGAFGLLATPSLGYPLPVTMIGYWAQRQLFGLDPLAFHAVSLVLHIGVAVLVAALARRLGSGDGAAALLASLFAVHPLTVEPVVWVTGQKDLLMTLFLLAALVVRAHRGGERPARAAATAALIALALLSKPSGVCAPVLLFAVDWSLGRSPRAQLPLYAAVVAFAAIVAGLALWGHESQQIGPSAFFGLESLLEAVWTVKLQVVHVAFPAHLAAKYYPPEGVELAIGVAAGLSLLALWAAGMVHGARRDKRVLVGGLLAVAAAYAPTSGLLPLSRGPADSYMYLPLALAAAFVAVALARTLAARARLTIAATLIATVALAAWSAHTHRHWRNAITLWKNVAELNPEQPHALMNAASSYLWVKRPEVALELLELVEREHPDYVLAARIHAETLLTLGRAEEAEPRFARAASKGNLHQLDRYGYFLAKHDIEPSRPEIAHTAILIVTPELATRGINPATLRRAAELAESFEERAAATLLRRRLDAIDQR